jgi:hypothetical protein
MAIKKSSNKSFAILFSIVFLVIGLWPLINSEGLRVWSIVLSAIILILGLFQPKFLTPFNHGWIKFGEILGSIIAPIVMALVFFTVLTPLSIIIRIAGKDLLKMKFSKENSYWIKKEKNVGSMEKQF